MTGPGRPRASRWLALFLAGSALVAAVLGLPVASLAPVDRVAAAPAQTDEPPQASLRLVERAPWVGPEGTVRFVVAADGDVEGASVRIRLHAPLDDTEELARAASEDVGPRVFRSPPLALELLAPGPDGTRIVGLSTSPTSGDDFTARLTRPGVYPLVISLIGPDGEVLDELRTPVVRLGDEDDPLSAPSISVLVDVDAPPTLQPDGTRALPAGSLERLAPVSELLGAHPRLDLTVAAVPDTLDALVAEPDPAAAVLLDRLRGRDVLALPYLPLPLEALRDTDLIGLMPPLIDRGVTTLRDQLDTIPRRGVWDPATDLDADDAELLAEFGYDRILVPGADDEPAAGDDRPLVPAGPRPVADRSPLNGLVVDTELSADLAAPLSGGADAVHVLLAELVLRDDGRSSDVLVRPRGLAEGSALAALVDLLDREDAPVPVGGVGALTRFPELDAEPVTWTGPPGPDLTTIAPRILAVGPRLDTFSAIIDQRSSRADDLRLQIATAVAATGTDETRTEAIGAVEESLRDVFSAIRLTGQTDLNLTSRRGTLPIIVENDNPFTVDVLVRIRSDRLAFPAGEAFPLTVSGDGERIDVPVESLATGSVPVFVEVWTGDDRELLDSRQLNVRSTAISGVGLTLSLGALLVLVTWWFRNWRRSRRARAARGSPPDGTSPPRSRPMG